MEIYHELDLSKVYGELNDNNRNIVWYNIEIYVETLI